MTSIAILAGVAFLLTLLMTPACRTACQRFGWVDRPEIRKLHRAPIPRAGGIAIFLGYAAALILTRSPIGESTARHAWTILPAVIVAFATGLLDDLVNLRPRTKIAGQVLAALLISAAGIQIRNVGGYSIGKSWWHIPLTIVWLVGCANAVNLIDGLDGLAAGIGLFATAAVLLSALFSGNTALAVVAAPLLGALLGFLPYNFSPASIFMGDCGSNTVGFLLGCFTIMWSQTCPTFPAMAAPVIALAIPILDTALAIFRRFLRHQAIFAADRGHIHHRLLSRGFSPVRVACILYAAAGFFACLSILLTTGSYSGGPVLAAFSIVVWLALRYLRYDEFDSVRRILFGGVLRGALTADLSLRQLEAAINSAHSVDECWAALQSNGGSLGLSTAAMHVYGRTYSAQFPDSATPAECWSLVVPLDGAGTLDLEIPFGPAPASVAPLANSLRTVLAPKLETLRPKLALAAAAAAGSNSSRRW
jgi:UDP-GlcNAc:undecaprenyl-phosphate GlcNAc-1-phosphate transferase